jgi:hypothetical protein
MTLAAQAQTATGIFESIFTKVKNSQGYTTEINIEVYDSTGLNISSYQAEVKKHADYFYYQLNNNETYQNDTLQLTINHEQKIIQVSKNLGNSNELSLLQMAQEQAQPYLQQAKVMDKGNSWHIEFPEMIGYRNFRYVVNKNYGMESVEYKTSDGIRVNIDYANFAFNPDLTARDFSFAHIINEQFVPKPNYQRYQVINNFNL